MAADFETHASTGAYNAHYDRPAVLELLGDVAGKRVLDAACGPGLYAQELVRRGAVVTGFDLSRAMVELARRRAGSGADFHVLSFDDPLPFDEGSFDLVVCALAIHYAGDRAATLAELHRVLRPGGALVFSTQHPTVDWLRKGGSYFDVRLETDVWKPNDDSEWEVKFWREPLTSLAEAIHRAGFLIERLVEPLPEESMREQWPDIYERLRNRPDFLAFRLRRPA